MVRAGVGADGAEVDGYHVAVAVPAGGQGLIPLDEVAAPGEVERVDPGVEPGQLRGVLRAAQRVQPLSHGGVVEKALGICGEVQEIFVVQALLRRPGGDVHALGGVVAAVRRDGQEAVLVRVHGQGGGDDLSQSLVLVGVLQVDVPGEVAQHAVLGVQRVERSAVADEVPVGKERVVRVEVLVADGYHALAGGLGLGQLGFQPLEGAVSHPAGVGAGVHVQHDQPQPGREPCGVAQRRAVAGDGLGVAEVGVNTGKLALRRAVRQLVAAAGEFGGHGV